MIGIYKITSPTGKVYIGQTTNYNKRITYYKYLKTNTQIKIFNSLKKYGFDNHVFEFLIECNESDLNNMERYYQDLYDCTGVNGLNCRLTNSDDRSGTFSYETRKKMSLARLNNPQVYSKERREAIANCRRGKKMPRHIVDKILATRKAKGIKCSDETKKKISAAHKGRKASSDVKLKLSEASTSKVLVLDTQNGIYYNSIKEAAILNGINISTLNHWLDGKISVNKSNLIRV